MGVFVGWAFRPSFPRAQDTDCPGGSASVSVGPDEMRVARWMRFISSRTLPGHA